MGLKTGQAGINLIKQFEGCRLTAYKCPAGVWTIGYGHTAGVTAGQTITQAEADRLLVEDLAKYEGRVNKYYDRYRFNQQEFDALVSFAFNLGSIDKLTANGARSRAEIADKMLLYNKGGGRVLAGLTRRRKAERELFLAGKGGAELTAAEQEQFPILGKGSRGQSVLKLQEALKKHGYSLKADGIFGNETLKAFRAFQADNGLAVDGVVGVKTWGKLNSQDKTSVREN